MKRIGIIAAVILVLVIAGILVINGRKIDTDVTRAVSYTHLTLPTKA